MKGHIIGSACVGTMHNIIGTRLYVSVIPRFRLVRRPNTLMVSHGSSHAFTQSFTVIYALSRTAPPPHTCPPAVQCRQRR